MNKDFVLNNPYLREGFFVAGKNFGSGSSREHAAGAIAGYGFPGRYQQRFFADIHKNNELNNFVLPCGGQRGLPGRIVCFHRSRPKDAVEVDLPNQTVTHQGHGEQSEKFEINGYGENIV